MSNRETQTAHGTFSMGGQQHDNFAQEVIIQFVCDVCVLDGQHIAGNKSWICFFVMVTSALDHHLLSR